MQGIKPGGKSKVVTSLYASSSRTACSNYSVLFNVKYSGADKSLARPGTKQATATADFDFSKYQLSAQLF